MPGTAKVGAISKAQNCKRETFSFFGPFETPVGFKIWKNIEGGHFEDIEKFKKNKNEIFEQTQCRKM